MIADKDPMGHAIADFHATGKAAKLRVFSPLLEEDEIPVSTLFRSIDDMPGLEQRALQLATGTILDVGAGAGCHALALQRLGKTVTAIDISPLAVKTMQERGVKDVLEQDFFKLNGQYDTILMLMNGIGIVGTISRLPAFFMQVDALLAPGGQVLFDSSDICYLFEDEDGIIDLTGVEGYYGEMTYQMQYRGVKGELHGFDCELVAHGEHYDYLARLTRHH